MHFPTTSFVLLSTLLSLTSLTSAQYSSAASSTSSAPATATSGAVTIVRVSNAQGALAFTPAELIAPIGSWVEFRFWPRNHSVVQSSFDKPCEPLEGGKGIFTGFHSVAAGTTDVSCRLTIFR